MKGGSKKIRGERTERPEKKNWEWVFEWGIAHRPVLVRGGFVRFTPQNTILRNQPAARSVARPTSLRPITFTQYVLPSTLWNKTYPGNIKHIILENFHYTEVTSPSNYNKHYIYIVIVIIVLCDFFTCVNLSSPFLAYSGTRCIHPSSPARPSSTFVFSQSYGRNSSQSIQ